MVARLANLGGKTETGVLVSSLKQLPLADVVLFDLAPRAVADIAGDVLPRRISRAYRRYRHGAAAFKIDIALHGDIPWTNPDCERAGTVHVAGDTAEIVAAERAVADGRMPARPFVLVCQQYLADPSRSVGSHNPIWTYAHVPHGYTGDATEAILGQIERFAPGFRDRILDIHTRGPVALAGHNPNYVGGDIATGRNDPKQILIRPRLAIDPYSTGVPGLFICSAATPPGVGAHGMCGYNAAQSALRYLRDH
jgi:phytoene dehydrogenase-like protein